MVNDHNHNVVVGCMLDQLKKRIDEKKRKLASLKVELFNITRSKKRRWFSFLHKKRKEELKKEIKSLKKKIDELHGEYLLRKINHVERSFPAYDQSEEDRRRAEENESAIDKMLDHFSGGSDESS